MNAYAYIAKLIIDTLATGYGFIISGYNNDTGEDKTDYLEDRIERIYHAIPVAFKPVILPTNGVWQGTKERSLLVLFPGVISTDSPVVQTLHATVRVLAETFLQYEAIIINGGRFYTYNRPNNTVTLLGDTATDLRTDGSAEAYTEVFIDNQRTHFVAAFTITASPELAVEIEAAQQPLAEQKYHEPKALCFDGSPVLAL